MVFKRDAGLLQEIGQQRAAAVEDTKRVAIETHQRKGGDGGRHDFGLGGDRIFSQDIQVPLVVLAFAALGRSLVAETLCHREPLHGERQAALAGGHHAREGGGHFRAQRKVAS